jgi:hypothetical protein
MQQFSPARMLTAWNLNSEAGFAGTVAGRGASVLACRRSNQEVNLDGMEAA